MIDLSIIIVNWNTQKLLRDCLGSIFKYTKGLNYEIIVVDNGSADGSVEFIKSLTSSRVNELKNPLINNSLIKNKIIIKLIKNKNNLGFAKANNQGIRIAKGDYILLLNSDTKITENAFKKMVNFAEAKPKLGIAGPKLINPGDRVQKSTAPFYTLPVTAFSLFGGDRWLRRSYQQPQQVDWVEGSCFLVKKKVFNQVGLLDEKFFMYVEEMEFCYRSSRAGWQTWYYPEAEVYHLIRGSSANRQKAVDWIHQGLIYFYQKHFADWQLPVLKCLLRLKAAYAQVFKLG